MDLRRPRIRCLRLGLHERRPAHALDASGDHQVGVSGDDRAGRVTHRIQAGGAQAVERDPRDLHRQSRQQRRHPCHVAVVLAGLVGAAEHDVVDGGPVNLRVPRCQLADDMRGQVVRPYAGQRTGVPADRGAHPTDKVCRTGIAHVRKPAIGSRRASVITRSCGPVASSAGSQQDPVALQALGLQDPWNCKTGCPLTFLWAACSWWAASPAGASSRRCHPSGVPSGSILRRPTRGSAGRCRCTCERPGPSSPPACGGLSGRRHRGSNGALRPR